jgi:hypothetical protein
MMRRVTLALVLAVLLIGPGHAFIISGQKAPHQGSGAELSEGEQLGLTGAQAPVGDQRLNQKEPPSSKAGPGDEKAASAIAQNDPQALGTQALASIALEEKREQARPFWTFGLGLGVFLAALGAVFGLRWWVDRSGPQMPERRSVRW